MGSLDPSLIGMCRQSPSPFGHLVCQLLAWRSPTRALRRLLVGAGHILDLEKKGEMTSLLMIDIRSNRLEVQLLFRRMISVKQPSATLKGI